MSTYSYKGMPIMVEECDREYSGYFEAAAQHMLVVQKCAVCGLLRWEPGTGCPWCNSQTWKWQQVSGKGTIYSYMIIAAPKHGPFKDWGDFPVVLVELDEQCGVPKAGDGLRMYANLLSADFMPEKEQNIAIGKRVEVVFVDVGEGFALPQFLLSLEPPQGKTWQFKQS